MDNEGNLSFPVFKNKTNVVFLGLMKIQRFLRKISDSFRTSQLFKDNTPTIDANCRKYFGDG